MNATKQIYPDIAKSLDTSEILLIFSALSSREKVNPLFKPVLITSPSRIKILCLSWRTPSNLALMASERVDFPAPESPVNQKVAPFFNSNSGVDN